MPMDRHALLFSFHDTVVLRFNAASAAQRPQMAIMH